MYIYIYSLYIVRNIDSSSSTNIVYLNQFQRIQGTNGKDVEGTVARHTHGIPGLSVVVLGGEDRDPPIFFWRMKTLNRD